MQEGDEAKTFPQKVQKPAKATRNEFAHLKVVIQPLNMEVSYVINFIMVNYVQLNYYEREKKINTRQLFIEQ